VNDLETGLLRERYFVNKGSFPDGGQAGRGNGVQGRRPVLVVGRGQNIGPLRYPTWRGPTKKLREKFFPAGGVMGNRGPRASWLGGLVDFILLSLGGTFFLSRSQNCRTRPKKTRQGGATDPPKDALGVVFSGAPGRPLTGLLFTFLLHLYFGTQNFV